MRKTIPLFKAANKISIIGAGAIGKQTLFSILRTFPSTANLEIVFFNRTYEKALGYSDDLIMGGFDTDYLDKWHKHNRSADISIIPTSNESDIANSEVIIFTAGISAAILNSETREAALPIVHRTIKHFGKTIKYHAPESTIFMITNPVDVATQLMSEETGFESGRVIGSGTELDARRFRRYFFNALKDREFNDIKRIAAEVVGGHSPNNMIIAQDSIRIITSDSRKKISSFSKVEQEKIKEAYDIAEKKMKTSGFDMIELTNEGASIGPALLLSSMTGAFLYGKNPINITGSISLDKNHTYCAEESVISAPLSISAGSIKIDNSRFKLSNEEIRKLHTISNKHQDLINTTKDVPTHLVDKMEQTIDNLRKRTEELKKFFRSDPETKMSPTSYQKTQQDTLEKTGPRE